MTQSLILFGAFDRHNFGDMLFPHIVSRLLPADGAVEFAGLADRDLRPWGGHSVKSLSSINTNTNTTLIHVGGELLGCTAYQAAVMLRSPAEAQQAISQYDADPQAGARWAASVLQTRRAMPYVAGPVAGKTLFNAVGGVEWPLLGSVQQEEVIAALRQACWISVRDHVTQAHLKTAGVTASLCPDPAVMVKECFGDIIQMHSQQGEVAEMVRAFPNGFFTCQFSAEFGDDETLDQLAHGLGSVCAESGLGMVLFRAGAAPWHDQIEPYERLQGRMPENTVRVFKSLHLWDICALLASSRAFCGSSLHGGIVAQAYGLPHVGLLAPQQGGRPGKVLAYRETWETDALSRCASPRQVEKALLAALAQPSEELKEASRRLAGNYRLSAQQWMDALD